MSAVSYKPVQIAYHVPDPEAAAHRFASELGWGPFFLMEHIPLEWARHRGVVREFDHTSAYGQAGDMMVELITQHDDRPSALRDLFAADEFGVHHVAAFVPHLQSALAMHRESGRELALEARTTTGVEFAMVDTTALTGHMLELYEASEPLARFYAFVRKASNGWDGKEPLRRLRA